MWWKWFWVLREWGPSGGAKDPTRSQTHNKGSQRHARSSVSALPTPILLMALSVPTTPEEKFLHGSCGWGSREALFTVQFWG